MEIDMTSLTEEASSKVWTEIYGGAALPFEEQDEMIKLSMRSKVLPVVLTVIPAVENAVSTALKEKLIAVINESYEAGHEAEFTLTALMAELSEDD